MSKPCAKDFKDPQFGGDMVTFMLSDEPNAETIYVVMRRVGGWTCKISASPANPTSRSLR